MGLMCNEDIEKSAWRDAFDISIPNLHQGNVQPNLYPRYVALLDWKEEEEEDAEGNRDYEHHLKGLDCRLNVYSEGKKSYNCRHNVN